MAAGQTRLRGETQRREGVVWRVCARTRRVVEVELPHFLMARFCGVVRRAKRRHTGLCHQCVGFAAGGCGNGLPCGFV